jgi:hypothetical protein
MVDFIALQKEICRKCQAEYVETPFDQFIGIALDTLKSGIVPVHGLRHPKESEHSANWYIWAGEYSEAEDFFLPVHVRHLVEYVQM